MKESTAAVRLSDTPDRQRYPGMRSILANITLFQGVSVCGAIQQAARKRFLGREIVGMRNVVKALPSSSGSE